MEFDDINKEASVGMDAMKEIQEELEGKLKRCGLMYRIFARTKKWNSLEKKITNPKKNYGSGSGQHKVQDIIGLRIVFYFISDVRPFYDLLCTEPYHIEESDSDSETEVKMTLQSVTWPDPKNKISYEDVFRPTRMNMVMRMNDAIAQRFWNDVEINWGAVADKIDSTYEIQLRSVLSEGWHEVEHDLRYKYKEDWVNGYEKESRMLNSIYASLEANENAMERLFEDKAHQHYKEHSWEAMLRHHLRLRFETTPLSDEICRIFESDPASAKPFLRINRADLMKKLYDISGTLPITYDNMVFVINRMQSSPNPSISNIEPKPNRLDELFD